MPQRRRQKRNDEIRKQKKNDQLQKLLSTFRHFDETKRNYPSKTNVELAKMMDSHVTLAKMAATQEVRISLTREDGKPPIDSIIEAGIVPRLVNFLKLQDNYVILFDAVWALTIIATTHTKTVVEAGVVPQYVNLLSSPFAEIAEQAVLALGNIAGDGPPMRDYVVECGILKPLLKLKTDATNGSLFRNIIWTVLNLCRKPPPPIVVKECLPVLAAALNATDSKILSYACWAFSCLTEGSHNKIEEVIKAGVVPRLVELLQLSDPSIITPTLTAVGNLVTGSDVQTQSVLDAQVLPVLLKLLSHDEASIQKKTLLALSNITAGNTDQIQAVINAGIIPRLIELLKHDEFKFQKEVVWAITNFTSGATREQIAYLVHAGAMPAYCHRLSSNDSDLVKSIIDGLGKVLQEMNTKKT